MTRIRQLLGHEQLEALDKLARPDFKSGKRIKDRAAGSRKLHTDPACRVCGERATEPHHIVLRSQQGDDVEDNLMPLCLEHHQQFHQNGFLPARLTRKEVRYVNDKLGRNAGRDYIARRYHYTGR